MKKIAEIAAPAKAILCGEHAVVYGQDALAFGVDLKCLSKIYTNNQSVQNHSSIINLKIHISNSQQSILFDRKYLQKLQKLCKVQKTLQFEGFHIDECQMQFQEFCSTINDKQNSFSKIALTTLYKIVIFCFSFQIDSTKYSSILKGNNYIIQTTSQIPIGKGLGSSAAFNSVLATSLLLIFGIIKKEDIQKDQKYKVLANHISKLFQKVQHGKPSGVDNFVSVNGGMVLFNRNKTPPFKLINDSKIISRLGQNFCIGFIDSQIQKNTKLAVNNVFQKYNQNLNGEFKYKKMIQQIGTFPNKIINLLSDDTIQLQNMQREILKILKLNHQYLRQLGLSNNVIQEIVSEYTIQGKMASKITGAGMGGVVLLVGDKKHLNQLKNNSEKLKRPIIICQMNTIGLQIKFSCQEQHK